MRTPASITAQISTAIQQVAANAKTSAAEASLAAETARSGARTVQETILGMQSIQAKVGLSAEKVQEMGQRSDQIGTIVIHPGREHDRYGREIRAWFGRRPPEIARRP